MKQPKTINVALGAIELGKNHRTAFDQVKDAELMDSINQVGVLQAIILRTIPDKNDGYQLIAGERRYRAAMKLYELDNSRLTIPAPIYDELSDADALEIQITENMQRENVHPMDEARAFKSLGELKGYEVAEIALRMGKTPAYVGRRLKLNDLIEDIQAAFSADKMDTSIALVLCKFDKEIQQQIFNKEIKKQLPHKIQLEAWALTDYQGNLALAAFDLGDATLNKAMGACATCQHNTGQVAGLFPEDAKNARCTLVSCFTKKVKTHFDRELKTVIDDGTVALITTEYGRNNNLSDKMKGHKIYNRSDYANSNLPLPPDIEGYEKDLNFGRFNSREEMAADFEKDLVKFEKEKKAYDKKVGAGQYTKAFIIAGEGAGKYVFVDLKKESQAIAKADELDVPTIEAEIKRLQEREERNQELDQEKNLTKIHEFISTFSIDENAVKSDLREGMANGNTDKMPDPLHDVELRALVLLLYNRMSWTYHDDFFDIIGWEETTDIEFYEHLAGLSVEKLQQYISILTRQNIIDHFTPKKGDLYTHKPEMKCLIDILDHDCQPQLKEIMDEQAAVIEKRQGRVNKRITDLTAAKAEIEKSQDNAEPGKKKAAKKQIQKTE